MPNYCGKQFFLATGVSPKWMKNRRRRKKKKKRRKYMKTLASFASSATMGGGRKHAWTNIKHQPVTY